MEQHKTGIPESDELHFEFPMYHKWHAILTEDLTHRDKVFERNLVGLSVNDVDKIYAVTGCRRLEEYLVRMALNDSVFSSLVEKSLSGKNHKSVNLIS